MDIEVVVSGVTHIVHIQPMTTTVGDVKREVVRRVTGGDPRHDMHFPGYPTLRDHDLVVDGLGGKVKMEGKLETTGAWPYPILPKQPGDDVEEERSIYPILP
eukprot:Sspe_Gene.105821::Locus_82930_Transcript_1_1_Confidence_1.000_Length_361::g.105821::m.105821